MANDWRETVEAVIDLQADKDMKTAPGPSLQWYPQQWLGDPAVQLMSMPARGCHHHLLMLAWKGFDPDPATSPPPCSLPEDHSILKALCQHPADWEEIFQQVGVAWKWFDGRIWNLGLCRSYLQQMKTRRGKQKGGRARAAQQQGSKSANGGRVSANAADPIPNAENGNSSSSPTSSSPPTAAAPREEKKDLKTDPCPMPATGARLNEGGSDVGSTTETTAGHRDRDGARRGRDGRGNGDVERTGAPEAHPAGGVGARPAISDAGSSGGSEEGPADAQTTGGNLKTSAEWTESPARPEVPAKPEHGSKGVMSDEPGQPTQALAGTPDLAPLADRPAEPGGGGRCPCGGELVPNSGDWAACKECGDDSFPLSALSGGEGSASERWECSKCGATNSADEISCQHCAPAAVVEAAKSGAGKSKAPKKLTPHQHSMKRLEDWFEAHEIPAPMDRQREINHGTLGEWLKACEGNAGRAIGILDHCLGANKIGSTSSWGYVFTLMEAHGATGMPGGNGQPRRGNIRPQSSAKENAIRDKRMRWEADA